MQDPRDDRLAAFADSVGALWVRLGGTATAGRIFGYLLTRDEPAGLVEIVHDLGVSKSGVSVATRQLEAGGALRRIHLRGSRRVAYEPVENLEPMIAAAFTRIGMVLDRLVEGERLLPAGPARDRIGHMSDLFLFISSECESMLARWRSDLRQP